MLLHTYIYTYIHGCIATYIFSRTFAVCRRQECLREVVWSGAEQRSNPGWGCQGIGMAVTVVLRPGPKCQHVLGGV